MAEKPLDKEFYEDKQKLFEQAIDGAKITEIGGMKTLLVKDIHGILLKSFEDYFKGHSNERIFVYGGSGSIVWNIYFNGSEVKLEQVDAYDVKGSLGREIRKSLNIKELDYLQ